MYFTENMYFTEKKVYNPSEHKKENLKSDD